MRLLERSWPVLGLLLPLIVLVLVADLYGSISVQRTVVETLIKVVMVVGLYIFIGNSGIVSFGHSAFMAIAAYAMAWQTCCAALKPITMHGLPPFLRDQTLPLLPAAAAAVVLAALVAFLVGLVLMRLSGLAASISTLAVLFILNVLYSNWDSVTMGASSIVGLPVFVTPWVALAAAGGVMVLAYLFQVSRWGLALRATREDDVAAQAVGLSLYTARLIAFTLSGAVLGLAGVLYAHFLGTISVDTFFLNMTFISLAMLVVGGMHSLAGAVVGVVVISGVVDGFRRLEAGVTMGDMTLALPAGTQELILALVMLLVLAFRREGLMGDRELRWPWRRQTIMERKREHA